MLTVAVRSSDIASHCRALHKHLAGGAQVMRRSVGFRGHSEEYRIYWRPRERFWAILGGWWNGKVYEPHRFSCDFGLDDPMVTERALTPVTKWNVDPQGTSRQFAGVLLRDHTGTVYLGHSGKIGGGRSGIGKRAFLDFYQPALEPATWPDGTIGEYILLGRLDSSDLPARLADFINTVARFKDHVASGSSPSSPDAWRPEFEGEKRYTVPQMIIARASHGRVTNMLAAELERLGHAPQRDQYRDCYVAGTSRTHPILFEVKTNIDTSSVYCALGQLAIHAAHMSPSTIRVLVVPHSPKPQTALVLRRMGIHELTYHATKRAVTFAGLTRLLRKVAIA